MSITRIHLPAELSLNIDGKIYVKDSSGNMQTYFKEILRGDPSAQVEISITRIDSKKTNPQLAYFFGVILPIIKARFEELEGTEFTKEEVINILKDKFFYEEIMFDGEFIRMPLSFSTAKKEEISKFLQKVIEFSVDILEVTIPYHGEEFKPNRENSKNTEN